MVAGFSVGFEITLVAMGEAQRKRRTPRLRSVIASEPFLRTLSRRDKQGSRTVVFARSQNIEIKSVPGAPDSLEMRTGRCI